jgi:hypothetical protein
MATRSDIREPSAVSREPSRSLGSVFVTLSRHPFSSP